MIVVESEADFHVFGGLCSVALFDMMMKLGKYVRFIFSCF